MTHRPITPLDKFELALSKANLSLDEYELIEYIRYISVFTQTSLIRDLKRPSKPPIFTIICEICRKIGLFMPEHFDEVRNWSKQISEHNTKWDGHLICAEAFSIDMNPLNPDSGTSLYDVMVVHKELFIGLD